MLCSYPKDSPPGEKHSLMLLIMCLRKQGNVPVQHLPQKIQWLVSVSRIRDSAFPRPSDLCLFVTRIQLFVFVREWKLRVPVISAACLRVMSGLARIFKVDLVSSILLKGK